MESLHPNTAVFVTARPLQASEADSPLTRPNSHKHNPLFLTSRHHQPPVSLFHLITSHPHIANKYPPPPSNTPSHPRSPLLSPQALSLKNPLATNPPAVPAALLIHPSSPSTNLLSTSSSAPIPATTTGQRSILRRCGRVFISPRRWMSRSLVQARGVCGEGVVPSVVVVVSDESVSFGSVVPISCKRDETQ